MRSLTIISTFYSVAPQMACIKEFSPSKLILITQKLKQGSQEDKTLLENEALLKKTIGVVAEVSRISVENPYDIYETAKMAVEMIEKEHQAKHDIIIHITGGRRTQALGILFAAYARNGMVKKLVYTTEEENKLVELPKLDFGITETKRHLLELLEEEPESMAALAKKLKKTRGMIYIHLRELKEIGLIDDEYKLTEAGRLALL